MSREMTVLDESAFLRDINDISMDRDFSIGNINTESVSQEYKNLEDEKTLV